MWFWVWPSDNILNSWTRFTYVILSLNDCFRLNAHKSAEKIQGTHWNNSINLAHKLLLSGRLYLTAHELTFLDVFYRSTMSGIYTSQEGEEVQVHTRGGREAKASCLNPRRKRLVIYRKTDGEQECSTMSWEMAELHESKALQWQLDSTWGPAIARAL